MPRPITSTELDLALSCTQVDPTSFVNAAHYRRDTEVGSYRPEWTWVHQDTSTDTVLARAVWWAPPSDDHPVALDCLWVHPSVQDPVQLASQLLERGHTALLEAGISKLPEYLLDVPTTWNDDPAARDAVAWRVEAATTAGLEEPVERLGLTWTSASPLPPRSTRLTFHAGDDAAFLDAFTAIAQGSLDQLTVRNLAQMGAQDQARDDLGFYASLPGRRDYWRLARNHGGDLVGMLIPSRSATSASVSYLGVLPAQRGRGYVDDLLAEITHVHAADGAPQITADTDAANTPMAEAFTRTGYHVTQRRLAMAPPLRWSQGRSRRRPGSRLPTGMSGLPGRGGATCGGVGLSC